MKPLEETEFWELVMRDVFGPREGGVIIVIDAENARKGVAKTSAAVSLAERLAREFEYDLQPEDGVLSSQGVLDRYKQQPGSEQPSVLVWDEAVGGGAGDARRSMSNQNIILSRAWQVLRTRRVVTITTLPNWGDLDSRLQRFADYRLWCREWPIGEFHAYKSGTTFDGGQVQTQGLGYDVDGALKIAFPDASADFPHKGDNDSDAHPLYQSLSERKQELMDTESFDAGELGEAEADAAADGGMSPEVKETVKQAEEQAKRKEAIKTVIRACKPWDDEEGMSYRDAAKLVDYKYSWVSNRVREWKDASEHRDLVEGPAK
jgi:hypothetical protein